MAKYKVEVKEQWISEVEVEARNEDEAVEKAKELANKQRYRYSDSQSLVIPEFSNYIGSDSWKVQKQRKRR